MPYVSHIDYRALVEKNGKRCSSCGHKKSADDFHVNRARYDGRAAYCKTCISTGPVAKYKKKYETSDRGKAKRVKWKKSNIGKMRRYSRDYRANKRLRDAMALEEKVYKREQSLLGSTLEAR